MLTLSLSVSGRVKLTTSSRGIFPPQHNIPSLSEHHHYGGESFQCRSYLFSLEIISTYGHTRGVVYKVIDCDQFRCLIAVECFDIDEIECPGLLGDECFCCRSSVHVGH